MAITTSGTISFKQGEFTETMHLPKASSLAALKEFALALSAYTDAAIVAVSFSTEETLDAYESTGESPLSSLATLLFHGGRGSGKTPSKNFALFAAKEEVFEDLQGLGLRVRPLIGQKLADAYGALTGETFRFIKGRLQQ
jgi:hypothetical protein